MARSQNSFNKKEKEKKKLQKKKEKQQRKEERKANSVSGQGLDEMIAYVDEFGNIVNEPPESKPAPVDESSIEVSVPKGTPDEMANSERRGRVAFFDQKKGYGFINHDGSQERVFVHSSNVEGMLQEGDKVSFLMRKGLKGMEAYSVRAL